MKPVKQYLETVRSYLESHKKECAIAVPSVLGVLLLVALFIYDSTPHYTYQPVKACDLLTPVKAEDLLGDKVISTDANEPVVSGDTATSKCGYTDENADQSKMLIAAVAVRSAVDDKGVRQNKSEFAQSQANNSVETVKGIGDSAYFNKTSGQLNVLSGRKWLIFNYGVASSPQTNTLDKAVRLAHKVLR